MKQQFLIIGLLVASASAESRMDDFFREGVEYVKQQMPCGFPKHGIPPVSPYTEDFRSFDLTNQGVNLKGNLTNLVVSGLNDFDIKEIAYSIIAFRIKFDFVFKQLKVTSKYVANGGLQFAGLPLPLNGNGDLNLILENVRFNGSFRIVPTTSIKLHVFAFKSNLDLGQIQSQTTGVNNSPVFTKIFNNIVKEFFIILSEDYKNEISAKINGFIVPNANRLLGEVQLVHLVMQLLGFAPGGENLPVCEV